MYILKAQELGQFDYPHRWILFCEKECIESVRKLSISISSDIGLCRVNGYESVIVEKIFKYIKEGELILESFGSWTKLTNVVITQKEENLFRRRNNFGGILLNTCIVVTNNDTLNHLTDKR